MVRRAKRGITFRMLAGLLGWLEHLLQGWTQDSASDPDKATPEFGWEAPDDWLRRATPQPPEDWVERVRTVMPEWEPPEPGLTSRLHRSQAGDGERPRPDRIQVAEHEQNAPVPLAPERIRFGKAAPLSPQALPPEARHAGEHIPEPVRLAPGDRIDEAEPQRVVLAPAELPRPNKVIARQGKSAGAPESELHERPPHRPAPAAPQPDQMLRQASRSEVAASQVTYGERRWLEAESVIAQPWQKPEADAIDYRQVQHEPAVDANKEMAIVQHTLPSIQEPLWIEEDRWPVLPERPDEQVVDSEGGLARRARLDREQEGKDAWTA